MFASFTALCATPWVPYHATPRTERGLEIGGNGTLPISPVFRLPRPPPASFGADPVGGEPGNARTVPPGGPRRPHRQRVAPSETPPPPRAEVNPVAISAHFKHLILALKPAALRFGTLSPTYRQKGETGCTAHLPRTSSIVLTRVPWNPAGRHKEKDRVRSAPPSKPGHDCPPRNVQLRQEYSTRIREVKISRVNPAAVASAKGAPALWHAAAMADQPDRRPGVYGLGVLGGHGYCWATALAWPKRSWRRWPRWVT